MGVFTRFKDIINSNINSMLDKAEDPEKMIRLIIREMEDTMVEMKSSCAEKIAQRSRINRERNDLTEKRDRWISRAEMAVEKGRDDLAREALFEKRDVEKHLENVDSDLSQLEAIIEEARENIAELEKKLDTVKAKHRSLMQRSIHAEETRRVRENINQANGNDTIVRFNKLEEHIERMEAENDLLKSTGKSELEDEFSRMESEPEIEDALAAIKKKVKDKAGE